MKSAVMYVRYSSDNQREESIEAQVRAIEEYAKKHHFHIIEIYADRAKSATVDKRPEFQRLIEDSFNGQFEAVLVHKLDRFSRNKYDSAFYKRKLAKNKVRLVSVLEQLDNSPESVILESVLEGMAEYYSKNLSREVMKGMKETALQCKHTGGQPPLGYDVHPVTKEYVINEQEASCIRLIYSMYLDGYGYNQIIKKLNELGYKTKKGKPFGKNSIHDLLVNEKYYGLFIFNKSVGKDMEGKRSNQRKPEEEIVKIPGGIPAIISENEFMKVQEKMKRNKRMSGTYRAITTYLLSGLIFCSECGHAMVGNRRVAGRNKNVYVTYRCGNRDKKKTCHNKEINKEYVEDYVLQVFCQNLFQEERIPLLTNKLNEFIFQKEDSSQAELRRLHKQLKQTSDEIENIVSAIAKGFTHESFLRKMDELENVKQNLIQNIHTLQQTKSKTIITDEIIRELLSQFKTYVKKNNVPEIKVVVQNFINRVTVHPDYVEIEFKK
ncbi:recombinase family protein (plasmid) [Aneurinibacillus sp. Ricciae_BoGa-3]|uniref:recombinase family protein n=1 Tax=Aneurinibacillus sp. Ricciae_BoGa-3 TaxID=3022697 RepID=UPI0023422014|nr:recombinase family protein [Aneurinibacillus sp. Ricciae_BoGa-3]WCK57616.1 recombinase family protein [Aneurinibacillus sp. Ricciae_BoGa-3]